MSDIKDILDRMERMEGALGEQTRAFDRLAGGLDVRCPSNERRLGEVERRLQNGNGGAGISRRALLAALAAITVLAGALATVATRALGGP